MFEILLLIYLFPIMVIAMLLIKLAIWIARNLFKFVLWLVRTLFVLLGKGLLLAFITRASPGGPKTFLNVL
jgi:hypothetical protein